jgi:Protein of unknwon function (DUF3310)
VTLVKAPNINYEDLPVPVDLNSIKPAHYKTGGMEPIDYMRLKMTKEQMEGFYLGNVVKYISRYQQKNGLEDVLKAEFYLKELIKSMKGETHDRD